ncbi:MAG: ABC transporter ATP-binding protein [Gemmatimonadales bacterium]
MDLALEVSGVSKRFGNVVAVDDVSFQIPYGSIYGFLGPNGAGKTTTLRMIMSIFYPDAGTIRVLGNTNPEAVKDRLGYLPEEKGLYKKMNAGEILAYFGKLKGMPASAAKDKARQLLTQFGLGDWIDQKCETLSKGMSQKVQILSTLIHDPELVILDEPFSGLDPVNVETVREMILRIKRTGKTVIFSTHVMEQAEQICDSILLINRGRKIIDGPIGEVRASGGRVVVVEYEGNGANFAAIPGVERVNDAGKHAEFTLADNTDPHDILTQLISQVRITRFEAAQPSLHEIFVRAVGGQSDE